MPPPFLRRHHITLLAGMVGAAVVVAAYFLWHKVVTASNLSLIPRPVESRDNLGAEEQGTIDLFERAAPSVVYITSIAVERDVLSANVLELPQGTGTGFIWDKRGYIVTNFHVIQNAQAVHVTLADRTTWDAQLVGIEPDKDLAVLRIDPEKATLQPLTLGTSKGLRVGQRVFAIGNPFGFDHTLTTGVISGLKREIKSVTDRPIQGVIQTDAAINPGNSGGPLLDSAGRLIGINTAIVSPSGAYAGIGFAVPVDTVNRIVPQLIKSGRVKKPGLGIRIIESNMLRAHGITGAVVADVIPGSPADLAGVIPLQKQPQGKIELGDSIISIDGITVEDGDDLLKALDEKAPGDKIILTLKRGQNERTVEVKLGLLQQ